jgi:hypothetical protein
VVQRGNRLCLALETFRKVNGRRLDGNCSIETGVGGAEHFSHASASNLLLNPVRTDLSAGAQF